MGLLEEIDAIIREVREAKPVPLSASAMINKKSLLAKLERIRRSCPEELRQARYVVQDREGLLSEAQAEIEKMRADAQAERDRLVARTEVVAAARREADNIIDEARNQARQIRMEADDYVDGKLANFEAVLQKTLRAVTRGRDALSGRLDVAGQPVDDSGELVLPSHRGAVRR
ncbi:MAG: hypothetical protein M3164_04280 [Actinomycetota bacterium]|nr:hypothetical protein [Actinomycetota bacterium]